MNSSQAGIAHIYEKIGCALRLSEDELTTTTSENLVIDNQCRWEI